MDKKYYENSYLSFQRLAEIIETVKLPQNPDDEDFYKAYKKILLQNPETITSYTNACNYVNENQPKETLAEKIITLPNQIHSSIMSAALEIDTDMKKINAIRIGSYIGQTAFYSSLFLIHPLAGLFATGWAVAGKIYGSKKELEEQNSYIEHLGQGLNESHSSNTMKIYYRMRDKKIMPRQLYRTLSRFTLDVHNKDVMADDLEEMIRLNPQSAEFIEWIRGEHCNKYLNYLMHLNDDEDLHEAVNDKLAQKIKRFYDVDDDTCILNVMMDYFDTIEDLSSNEVLVDELDRVTLSLDSREELDRWVSKAPKLHISYDDEVIWKVEGKDYLKVSQIQENTYEISLGFDMEYFMRQSHLAETDFVLINVLGSHNVLDYRKMEQWMHDIKRTSRNKNHSLQEIYLLTLQEELANIERSIGRHMQDAFNSKEEPSLRNDLDYQFMKYCMGSGDSSRFNELWKKYRQENNYLCLLENRLQGIEEICPDPGFESRLK